MPRPFTRAQALQNQAFLALLRRTGNARLAARELGANRSTFTKRRARDAAFAAEWDAALAVAHASLREEGAGARRRAGRGGAAEPEPRVIRLAGGRLQLRRPAAGRRHLTRADEQAFLAALSATANVRLSAAAAGFAHSTFYARARASFAFAREMRLALETGYERIEWALLQSSLPDAHLDDAWRSNDPPPIPPMSANQALQLLYLHHKTARLWAEAPYMRRRRGESGEAWARRRAADYLAGIVRDAEHRAIAANEQWASRNECSPHEPEAPRLPALDQVMGWSKARPRPGGEAGREAPAEGMESARGGPEYHPDVALFGGWRLKDWKAG